MKIRKIFKWGFYAILSILAIWIIAGCILVFYIAPRTDLKELAQNVISENINAKSSISDIDFTFFSSFPFLALSINDFTIYDTVSNDTAIYVNRARFIINIPELLNGRVAIRDITITDPTINYIVDSTGKNNLSQIIKQNDTSKDTISKEEQLKIFDFDNIAIENGEFTYSDSTTNGKIRYDDLNFKFQGQINLADTILDIRQGVIFIHDNELNFNGRIDKEYVDLNINHNLGNLSGLQKIAVNVFYLDFLQQTEFNGVSDGQCHIEGKLDESLHGITVSGRIEAKDVKIKSSKRKGIIEDGEFELGYRFITGEKDSTSLMLDYLNLHGEYFSVQVDGSLSSINHEPFINANLKTGVYLTRFIKYTSLLPTDETLEGNLKADLSIHSSINDLKYKYKFPKSLKELYGLNLSIVLPNIKGTINLEDIKIQNDTIKINADKLNIVADGGKSHLSTDCQKLTFTHKGKLEDASIKVSGADIDIDGKNLNASVKIKDADVNNVISGKDTSIVSVGTVDLKLACKGKDIADVTMGNLSFRRGENTVNSDRIEGHLMKLSKNPGQIWDACSLEVDNSEAGDDKMKLSCKKMAGSLSYNGEKLYGLKATADAIDLIADENDFHVTQAIITSDVDDIYTLTSPSAKSGKEIFGMKLGINDLKAGYNTTTNIVELKADHVVAGNTDITAYGTIDLTEKSPVIDMKLSGKYLDLNEIMIACNKIALASGDPNAVPLDSIPEGQIPVTVGAEGQDITLALDIDKMTLTSLMLSNVTGTIYMKGKTTLMDDIKATDSGYKLNMQTMISYVNRRLSINDIILNFEKLDLSTLGKIIPSFEDAIPLLSTLKGSVDLFAVIRTPVRQILTIDMIEGKGAVAIQAKNLSVTDNEALKEVAKNLMFKDKEHINIDSIAIAAEIENGQLRLLPVMAKIDRYKLALTGENDMVTKQMDYHISVLKSPIPFKFGIDIQGNDKKQKTKIVKTELKNLDPSVKPWTDPGFVSYSDSLKQPIENFRKSIQ